MTGAAGEGAPSAPYRLHWVLRDRDGAAPVERVEAVPAGTDPEAIALAQAAADAADDALLRVELTGPDGQRIWGLERGEVLSQRPGDAR